MQIKAFTLIELLIVILLIGISINLVVRINFAKHIEISDLRSISPENRFVIDANGIHNKEFDIKLSNVEIFLLRNNLFEKRDNLIYRVKRGINYPSFILKCNRGIYVFKPLKIIKVNSIDKAKKLFLTK